MTSFSSSSSGFQGRSLHGHNKQSTGTNLEIFRDIYRYQILYSGVIELLNNYITFFTTGDFESLNTTFTTTTQNNLTAILQESDYYYNTNVDKLNGFTYDTGTFENFRNNTYYVLNGLIQSVQQYNQLEVAQNELSVCNEILSSEETILAYLNSLRTPSVIAFTSNQRFNTNIVLKPWYERYFILYGAPNDGVFATEKMAVAVQQLIDEGVITLEQFKSNTV